jgi:serine protease Do
VKFANASAEGEGAQRMIPGLPEGPWGEFFKQFPQFRDGMPGERQRPEGGMGQGSGFIISADGYAVTNNHVVKDANEVTVTLNDGTELKAEVIGTDPKTDLALIKIDSDKKFDFVSFTDGKPRVGDWVMAVGNPFGLGGTVTTGIISASGRVIGAGPYDDFLQIDAAINRGNSGGPAFNLEGEVVGINTAIFSPSGGSVGIGFAIPASTAENVIASLKETGTVTRGWLGVRIQPVTEDIAESLGLAEAKGAIVSDVTEDSPALAAGITQGDTILKVDGKEISDSRDLSRKVAELKPGQAVPVTVVRDGKTMEIEVKIGTMPDEPKMASATGGGTEKDGSLSLSDFGLKVAPAQDGAGVTVTEVTPGSAAAERGLKAGDVILEVAGTEVNEPADVRSALKANTKKRVLLLVKTEDGQRFLALPTAKG